MATLEDVKAKALVKFVDKYRRAAFGLPEDMDDDKAAAVVATMKAGAETNTTRYDRRFPNCNQVHNCWTAVNEYQLCVEKKGEKDPLCLQRARDYSTVCPEKWVENLKSAVDSGMALTVGTAFIPKA